MTLLNDPASLPTPMWTVVRFLSSVRRPMGREQARAYLSPPALREDGKMFDWAVNTLADLGLLDISEGDRICLADPARHLDGQGLAAFQSVLRAAVLDPERNAGLGEDDSQIGPRDLTRALVWFLSLDPSDTALNWAEAEHAQVGMLPKQVGVPFANGNRWNNFTEWAPVLGLAAPSPLETSRLTPDCTTAVRQEVQARWKPGERVPAVEALNMLRAALPVLGGGAYAEAVGLPSPGEAVAGPALSFALLRGDDEEWLRLEREADAPRNLSVYDPGQPSYPRTYSSITILEGSRG
ncbi:protein DpdG [Streptomyces hainanensis]|uniref:Uncharacterized protein n=1 Tax=Streptomyces hainanensis TaxID=402648 RepID=A0A4R4TMA3_9ACTN|nr:protein DpdG [Streptomyces hainanensis]TDC79151.1 hypothetical protein E1283_03395 [Streptomyces hainanensis]